MSKIIKQKARKGFKIIKQKARKGFAFRHPTGELDHRVMASVEGAQAIAAVASAARMSACFPYDWDEAYKKGYRIVPVKMVAENTQGAWKSYQGFKLK